MRITDTALPGVRLIESEPRHDERGWFVATFRASELAAAGLDVTVRQCASSHNDQAGTIRGMHFQSGADAESKYVRCTRGRAFDVVVDLRRESPTFRKWVAHELTAGDNRMLYIPPGCAHGFQTLEDDTELSYFLSHEFREGRDLGVRWDDPAFGIRWPRACEVISRRDATFPDVVP